MSESDIPVPWPRETRRQGEVGLVLAAAVLVAFVANFVFLVFHVDIVRDWPVALVFAIVQVWLSVGLFIVAHDCMHGSALPAHRNAGHWLGRLCLILYAGFDYDRLRTAHYEHHRVPGTAADPDFDEHHPRSALPWFAHFVREYFGWREFAILTVFQGVLLALGANVVNILAFWALPAVVSAFQLFWFGTFLPHREGAQPFVDRHRSRSNDVPGWASLLTCYHFGYHHEHHLYPYLPWWRLPEAHAHHREQAAA